MIVTRLIYFSENQIDREQGSLVSTLTQIARASNRNNEAAGITGALVVDDQWFLQVLEGERRRVWQTFERIRDDERHSDIVIAEVLDVEARTFGNWWMGLADMRADRGRIVAPYLVDDRLNPHAMTGRQMLALTVDLAALGLSRAVSRSASAPVHASA